MPRPSDECPFPKPFPTRAQDASLIRWIRAKAKEMVTRGEGQPAAIRDSLELARRANAEMVERLPDSVRIFYGYGPKPLAKTAPVG